MVLPPGFADLKTAYTSADNSFVNIIGVVVDKFPLAPPTRGTSYMFTFKLLDEGLYRSIDGSQGLTCRFFRDDPDDMPKVRSVGDIVLMRNAKMTTFQQQKMAMSNLQTSTIVFPGSSIPTPDFSIAFKTGNHRIERLGRPKDIEHFDLAEQEYIIHLKQAMNAHVESITSVSASTGRRRDDEDRPLPPPAKRARTNESFGNKFRQVGDLHQGMWADLCGIVIKSIGVQYGCDMYITDYTENEAMRYYPPPEEAETNMARDGDDFGYNGPPRKAWQGPWGQIVLKVNIKPPHAHYAAREIREGDVVLLRNVKTRNAPMGGYLEGDLWPDDQDRQRIHVSKVVSFQVPEIQAMFDRKNEYWAKRDAMLAVDQTDERSLKNKGKKRKKSKKKQGNEKQSGGAAHIGSEVKDSAADLARKAEPSLNRNVRCGFDNVDVTRIRDILDVGNARHTNQAPNGNEYTLPFINARYRARVRVVDYEPKALEEFAIRAGPHSQSSPDDTDWAFNSPQHEWCFSLLLEDATNPKASIDSDKDRLWIQVHQQQAQYLFGNSLEDPDDLRQYPRLLASLREKLWILWGNLEEKSENEALDNKPFECCIEEYGVELDQDSQGLKTSIQRWQRMHAIFGATIL